MKSTFIFALILAAIVAVSSDALAGGKPAGASCHVSKSCSTGLCVRVHPEDKFGICCQPANCAQLNAQCGMIANGCGFDIDCGICNGDCINNQCIQGTTTTSTTTTSSTSSTTTSTSSTTSTTGIAPTCGCVGGTPEGEADCGIAGDPPTDTTNGGCNSDPNVYSTLHCGDTICGTVGTTGGFRDTDWYHLDLAAPTDVVLTLTTEFDGQAGIMNDGSGGPSTQCNALSLDWFINPAQCVETSDVTRTLSAGTWSIFVASSAFDGIPCGAPYTLTLTCPPPSTTTTSTTIP